VRCPSCGHENIAGEDQCERCQAAFMQDDVPQPETRVTRSLMTDPISGLHPPPSECVPAGSSLAAAIAHMKTVNKGYVCVIHPDGTLAGIFTEREVIDKVAGQIRDLSAVTVDTLMTQRATALQPSVPIAHGVHMMAIHGFRHLPLVDGDGRPGGILSSRRIVEYIQEIA
jgi:CBS domain-containing protein